MPSSSSAPLSSSSSGTASEGTASPLPLPPPPTAIPSAVYYGTSTKEWLLPVIQSPGPTPAPPIGFRYLYPAWINETCGMKIITGAIMGSVLGVGLGLFMGAMGSDLSPIQVISGREVPMAPVREQLRAGYKSTLAKSAGWAKNFGALSALFGGVDCLIEKYRGKHDSWNPVISGCVVGATLAAGAGPAAQCVNCAGFAAFSFVMDKFMGNH